MSSRRWFRNLHMLHLSSACVESFPVYFVLANLFILCVRRVRDRFLACSFVCWKVVVLTLHQPIATRPVLHRTCRRWCHVCEKMWPFDFSLLLYSYVRDCPRPPRYMMPPDTKRQTSVPKSDMLSPSRNRVSELIYMSHGKTLLYKNLCQAKKMSLWLIQPCHRFATLMMFASSQFYQYLDVEVLSTFKLLE